MQMTTEPISPNSINSNHEWRGKTDCPLCGGRASRAWLTAPDRFHGRRTLYHLAMCSSCSLIRLVDPPTIEMLKEHYGAEYDETITAAAAGSPYTIRRHKMVTKHSPPGVLLDIGCGSGSFLSMFAGSRWQTYGIEISERAAAEAIASSGAQVFVGDLHDAPFAPGMFDVITCFDVLEHLHEPRLVVDRIRTWLKPHGIDRKSVV